MKVYEIILKANWCDIILSKEGSPQISSAIANFQICGLK
jgi:hypothetical protein